MNKYSISVFICVFYIFAQSAFADRFLFNNDRVLDGVVVEETDDDFSVKTLKATLTIKKSSLKEHLKEPKSQYYLRIADIALVENNLPLAKQRLEMATTADPENDNIKEMKDELERREEILKNNGKKGYQKYLDKLELLHAAKKHYKAGDVNASLKEFERYFRLDTQNESVVIALAQLHLEKMIQSFRLLPPTLEEYKKFVGKNNDLPVIEFIDSANAKEIDVLKRPKELLAPFAFIKKLPVSPNVLREVHKKNRSHYQMIYYIDRYLRLQKNKKASPLPDPTLAQWQTLLQMIYNREEAIRKKQRVLTSLETQKMLEAMEIEREKNRQISLNNTYRRIIRMQQQRYFGKDLESQIDYYLKLNPTLERVETIQGIQKENDKYLERYDRVRQASTNSGSAWSDVPSYKTEHVIKGGAR